MKEKPPDEDHWTDEIELKCTCKKYEWEKHFCPFLAEIENDFKTLCVCCPFCTEECALDI